MKTFAEIITEYIALDPDNKTKLAQECEAAPSTITRWANGTVKPMSGLQKYVIAWIEKNTLAK